MSKQVQVEVTDRLEALVRTLHANGYHPGTYAGPLWLRSPGMDAVWGRFVTQNGTRRVVDIHFLSPVGWPDNHFEDVSDELNDELGYLRREQFEPSEVPVLLVRRTPDLDAVMVIRMEE